LIATIFIFVEYTADQVMTARHIVYCSSMWRIIFQHVLNFVPDILIQDRPMLPFKDVTPMTD